MGGGDTPTRTSIAPEAGGPQGARGSRRRLIDAAVELILEHHRGRRDPRDVYAFLTPRVVAEHAGLSRGLIYHHWGESETNGTDAFGAFLDTVVEELWRRVAIPEGLADLADVLPDNLGDVVTTLAEVELERLAGADSVLARAVLVLSVHGMGRPEDTVEDTMRRLAGLYDRLLDKLDLEMVPPLTSTDLAFTVMCLLDGFTANQPAMGELVERRYAWEPRVPPEQCAGVDWTLFAIGVESIALNMTRPASTE